MPGAVLANLASVPQRYAVVVVEPPGYVHSEAFREVAESLAFGLRALGQEALLAAGPVPGHRSIVLGSNLLPSNPLPLAPDSILYNLEQIEPGSVWLTPALLELFRRQPVWEYSERNAAQYPGLGLPAPRVVPIGFVPELVRIPPAPAEDIDVLFYGSVNERRRLILEALSARGLRVHTAFGVYGAARDSLIARSKVVLNLHYYEAKVFEVVRISYLLANRRCVVSERGAAPTEEREFEGGVAFAAYGELVETCARLCADAAARSRLAETGHQVMAQRDARAYLAEALDIPFSGESAPANARQSPAPAPLPAYYQFTRPEVVARVRPAGQRILDVGCAAGAMGAAMLAAGAVEVAGIEVHPPAAGLARSRLSAVYGYDLDQLPALPYPDRYFDVITAADVLEHVRNPAALLRHLRRWLSDSGRLVCSIPNVRHQSVLLPLLVHGRWDYVDAGILDRTHLRFFTVDSMRQLLSEAGFAPEGTADAVASAPSPELERVAELVASLGGDAARFREEARVVQLVLTARPRAASGARPPALADPWRGSRPVRILLAPDLADPGDRWPQALAEVVASLGAADGVTVAVALPRPVLQSPPEAFRSVAKGAKLDLLLTAAPCDAPGWERLLGGASVWVATSARRDLRPLAQRVGLEVRDLGSRAA